MQYSLNINIDAQGLQQIYSAGQSVTIVKSVVSTPMPSGNLPVAWVSFQPLQTNTITWIENYNIYATTTALIAGATIVMTSTTQAPAQLGQMYTLEQGSFVATGVASPNVFNTTNEQGSMFSFGLAQSAIINGTAVSAPLNAVPILNGEFGTFTPQETLSVFLTNSVNNGVVLSQVYGTAATVMLTSQDPSATLGFNDTTNAFYEAEGGVGIAPLHQRLTTA